MRPFVIDEETKSKFTSLALHAERNPFSMDDLLDVYNKAEKPAGDFSEFTLMLPFGYKVVYSIEKQVKGDVRHFSMSVDADGKLPNEMVVRECLKMLGFKNELENCIVRLEDYAPKRQAINVLEVI